MHFGLILDLTNNCVYTCAPKMSSAYKIFFRQRLSVQLGLYVFIYFISICVELFDIDIDRPFSIEVVNNYAMYSLINWPS